MQGTLQFGGRELWALSSGVFYLCEVGDGLEVAVEGA